MRWDIAHAARIPILVPRAANLRVLLIYDVLVVCEIIAERLDHIYSARSSANGDDSKTTCSPKGLLQNLTAVMFVSEVAGG